MAIFNAYSSVDMQNEDPSDQSMVPTMLEDNHIQISDGTDFYNFYGNFVFNPFLESGTIFGIDHYVGAKKIYEVLELNLDASVMLDDSLSEEEVDALVLASNDSINGSNDFDHLKSYAGNDIIEAEGGNDIINAGSGNDSIHGGSGVDTAIFSGTSTSYTISGDVSALSVTGTDGDDSLSYVERLHFDDKNIAFDIDDTAGEAYRLYKAAFDRIPDAGGLGFWINALDNGAQMSDVAAGFTNSAEFISQYGTDISNSEFINLLYNNVLDRDADQGGIDFWLGHMNSGALSREGVLIEFSESAENQSNVIELIASGIEYTEWVA